MKKKINIGIKTRFISYVSLVFLLFLVILFYFYFSVKNHIFNEICANLTNISQLVLLNIDDASASYISKIQYKNHHNILIDNLKIKFSSIKKKLQIRNIFLTDLNMRLILSADDIMPDGLHFKKDAFEFQKSVEEKKIRISKYFINYYGENIMSSYSPVIFDDKVVAVLIVELQSDFMIKLNTLFDDLLIFTASGLGMLVIISLMFSRYIIRPIAEITNFTEVVSAGRFESRLDISNQKDEISELSSNINSMVQNMNEVNKILADKENQAALRAEEMEGKLKESEQLSFLGTMAAVVAHEIRNPLSGISGFLELLERNIEKNEKNTRLLTRIKKEISTLNGITSDYLLLSSNRNLDLRIINLNNSINHCIQMMEKEIMNKKITIKNSIADSISLFCEEALFEKAILNILINSVSAISHNNGLIEIKCIDNAEYLTITIADNGLGFDETEKLNLFNLFYTTKKHGTGLGLAVTKRIVERHNGSIEMNCSNSITLVTLNFPKIK